jgi:hypothetical protein
MSNKMNRQEMIALLHELDTEFKANLEFEICGASSAIINYGLKRTSTDIDVLRVSLPFTGKYLHSVIEAIAARHGSESLWINDNAKEVFKHIPEDINLIQNQFRANFLKI